MHSHVVVAHSVVKVNVAVMRYPVCVAYLVAVAGKGARCEDEGKSERDCCDQCGLHEWAPFWEELLLTRRSFGVHSAVHPHIACLKPVSAGCHWGMLGA